MEYGKVDLADWGDKPTFIIGGGTSIKPFLSRLKELNQYGHVIACNDSYKYCSPDIIFSTDYTWIEKRLIEIPNMPCLVMVAVNDNFPFLDIETKNLVYLKRPRPVGKYFLSEDATKITNGLNTGFGALNLAFLKGSKEIYLFGFDFMVGKDEASHFHEGYSWHGYSQTCALYPKWAKHFDDTIPQLQKYGVKVWNCSNRSLLKSFPYKEPFTWSH